MNWETPCLWLGVPLPSVYAHTGASSCSWQGICVGSHAITDTHRHVDAYTVCSVCKCVHWQRQAGTQPGDTQACECSRVHTRGHVNRVLCTQVDFWSCMVGHLYKAWCAPMWRGMHTLIGPPHREGMSESPETSPGVASLKGCWEGRHAPGGPEGLPHHCCVFSPAGL